MSFKTLKAFLSPLFANLWILLFRIEVMDVSDPDNIAEITIKQIIYITETRLRFSILFH